MISYQKKHNIKAAAVIGGGLLGLEAAKAMYDLGMETHIIEYAPILMCRQVHIYIPYRKTQEINTSLLATRLREDRL